MAERSALTMGWDVGDKFTAPLPARDGRRRSRTVLVIEDDPDVGQTLVDLLRLPSPVRTPGPE